MLLQPGTAQCPLRVLEVSVTTFPDPWGSLAQDTRFPWEEFPTLDLFPSPKLCSACITL